MDNLDKYTEAFINAFNVEKSEAETLQYESIKEWDSVGHMVLIAELEAMFDITMEMDDIIDLSSFEKGKELLLKYSIVV